MHTTRNWHRRAAILAALVALAGFTLGPGLSHAATETDLRAGVYTDTDGAAFGAGLLTSLDAASRWYFNPNIEAAFADRGNLISLNADFHYDLPASGAVSIYMGGGPALLVADPDGGDSQTDVGLNLLAGFAGLNAPVRPFAQVKGILSDGSEVAIMGGIRF